MRMSYVPFNDWCRIFYATKTLIERIRIVNLNEL